MAGWDRGARRRFVVLASARVGAQGLSIAWFLLAARALSEAEFGLVSTGLTFLAVLVGIGDLGMSRTIVRHVAVDHSLVWPMFRAAVPVRVLGTAAVAVLAAIAVAWADVGVPTEVVLVAGGIAVVSGITELAYAGLRATGAITVEVVLMLSERGLFLVGGVVVLARGGGAIGVLLLYLLTNGISATAAASRVYRRRPPSPPAAPWVLDVEARVTAMAFALVTIGPRVAPLLLALLATPADVGIYAVAQRPMEAVTLFTLSTAAPLLPIVRERYGAGHDARGDAAALSVLGALSVCLAPLLSWFIIDPSTALTTLFGPDRYLGADTALRLLAITALTWTWRGVGEAMLLAGHRAQDFLRVNIAGTVTCLAVGLPSVLRYRSAGAAMAVVSAELVMTLWLVHVVPAFRRRKALPFYVPTVLAAGLSGGALIAVRGQVIPALALVVAFTAVALAVAIRMIKDLELR